MKHTDKDKAITAMASPSKNQEKVSAATNSVAADTPMSTTSSVEDLLNSIDAQSEMSKEMNELLALKPVLEKLHELLVIDQDNIINKILILETDAQRSDEKRNTLINAINAVIEKINSINKHIDAVMKTAPEKLKVTISISETDKT